DDVAAQVGDLGAVQAVAEVFVFERPVEGEAGPVNGLDGSLYGGAGDLVHLAARGDDDAVARLPTADRLGQGDGGAALRGRGAELAPVAAGRGAVETHAPAAADDGGARLLIHALEVHETNQGGVPVPDGPLGRADLQRGPRRSRL